MITGHNTEELYHARMDSVKTVSRERLAFSGMRLYHVREKNGLNWMQAHQKTGGSVWTFYIK